MKRCVKPIKKRGCFSDKNSPLKRLRLSAIPGCFILCTKRCFQTIAIYWNLSTIIPLWKRGNMKIILNCGVCLIVRLRRILAYCLKIPLCAGNTFRWCFEKKKAVGDLAYICAFKAKKNRAGMRSVHICPFFIDKIEAPKPQLRDFQYKGFREKVLNRQ